MDSEYIHLDQRKNLAVITLNRSEMRDALSLAMVKGLGKQLQFCSSPDVRAVLITGAGKPFAPGLTLRISQSSLKRRDPRVCACFCGNWLLPYTVM